MTALIEYKELCAKLLIAESIETLDALDCVLNILSFGVQYLYLISAFDLLYINFTSFFAGPRSLNLLLKDAEYGCDILDILMAVRFQSVIEGPELSIEFLTATSVLFDGITRMGLVVIFGW